VDNKTHDRTKQLETPTYTIVDAVGCTGSCSYTWNGQSYVLTGSCSGGGTCPSCPEFYDGDIRALVCQLPALFPNPDDISIHCGLTVSSQVTVPLLNLYLDALRGHARKKKTPKQSNKP
jgi:hypothetical protein